MGVPHVSMAAISYLGGTVVLLQRFSLAAPPSYILVKDIFIKHEITLET